MGGTSSMHGEMINACLILVKKSEGGDQITDGMITLKCI